MRIAGWVSPVGTLPLARKCEAATWGWGTVQEQREAQAAAQATQTSSDPPFNNFLGWRGWGWGTPKRKRGAPEGAPQTLRIKPFGRTNLNSERMNLSGSKHRGLSQHLQYLDSTGSSVQDFPAPRCGQHSTLTPSTGSSDI